MRVIAGQYRGRPLKAPKGDATRPTVDRVRESLMSSIMSLRGNWDDAVVLDAFAGSGALGMEALSRGADFACFCERNAAALDVLRTNVAMAPRERVRVWRGDVTRHLPPPPAGRKFDLVFLDPPYAVPAEDVAALLHRLMQEGSVAPGAIVAYEHDARQDPLASDAFLSLELRQAVRKKFGTTIIDILTWGDE